MVARYRYTILRMDKADDGPWMAYDDYAALKVENYGLRAMLKVARCPNSCTNGEVLSERYTGHGNSVVDAVPCLFCADRNEALAPPEGEDDATNTG